MMIKTTSVVKEYRNKTLEWFHIQGRMRKGHRNKILEWSLYPRMDGMQAMQEQLPVHNRKSVKSLHGGIYSVPTMIYSYARFIAFMGAVLF